MKAHRNVIAWVKACGATLLLVSPLAAERLIVRTYSVADGLPSDHIACLVTDRDGFLWICTVGGLSRFDGSQFVTYGTTLGLPDPVVNDFLQTRSGSRWVATNGGGVARLEPGADGRTFEPFDVGSTPRSMRVNTLFETRDGALLAGTDGGLFRARHPDAAPRFEPVPLALPGFPDTGLQVWTIAEDSDGRTWVGTSGGLMLLRGARRFAYIQVAPTQSADHVYDILPDAAGRLWLGHQAGVGSGRPFTKLITTFHRDAEGMLWFLRDDGVLRYEPRPLLDRDPPAVRIAGVQAAGVPMPVTPMGTTSLAPPSLGADQSNVRFDYFGLGFGADAPLRFQVKLDGIEDEWGSPTSQSTVLYGGLAPGRYRFQVRAVSATGQVSAEPATVDFTILPPFWQHAWFLAGLTALLAAALLSGHRLRTRRVLELERIRTRIAADLHDDLGASLARVSLLSEAARRTLPDRPDRAERMLHEIGTTSRELVTAAGDIAFSIDPGRGRLDSLVARLRRCTEDLLADTGIDSRFTVDGEITDVVLSSDQRRHLLAIVKEALHNAVRHARARHVSLTLALRGDVIEADLADDGCGFRTDISGNGRPQAGHGLRNMRDRASELGAHLEIISHPAGGGTRVSLRCPLRSRPRMIMR